jgi:subtilisin family serine protease
MGGPSLRRPIRLFAVTAPLGPGRRGAAFLGNVALGVALLGAALLGLALGGCSSREELLLAPVGSATSSGPIAGSAPDDDPTALPQYHVGGSPGVRPIRNVPIVPGEVVVKLEQGNDFDTFNAVWGTSTVLLTPEGFARLSLAEGAQDPWGWSDEMFDSEGCEHAEPNFLTETPESHQGTLPFYEGNHVYQDVIDQEALARIGIPAAHASATGQGVVIAVLDTGIDATHPAFAGAIILAGRDFVDDDLDPSDARAGLDSDGDGIADEAAGHGTHVAGLVHAVAPNASILPVRVLDSEGRGTSMNVARAIRWAADNGADVINLSLGMYADADVIKRAIQDVHDVDVLVINAAGNLGRYDEQHFPSRMSRVVSVAGSDADDGRAEFSNWGSSISLTAPGVGILSAGLDHSWAVWSGTSMSAPLVTGAAALYLELQPAAAPGEVEDAIEQACAPLNIIGKPWQDKMGAGRLDCVQLVSW